MEPKCASKEETAVRAGSWLQLKVRVTQRGRRETVVFQTDDIQMAVVVFVKFVVGFTGHEFHELTELNPPQLLRSSGQSEVTRTNYTPGSCKVAISWTIHQGPAQKPRATGDSRRNLECRDL